MLSEKLCSDCGRNHAKDKLAWPVGCKVEAIVPVPFYHGRFPAGIHGEVVGHTDDGRPVVKFERDRDTHTFHQPEEMLKWVGGTATAMNAAEVALIEGPMTPRQFAEKWLLDNADSLDYDKRHEVELAAAISDHFTPRLPIADEGQTRLYTEAEVQELLEQERNLVIEAFSNSIDAGDEGPIIRRALEYLRDAKHRPEVSNA